MTDRPTRSDGGSVTDAGGFVDAAPARELDASPSDAGAAAADTGSPDAAAEPLPECETLYGGCPATVPSIECPSPPVETLEEALHCRCASGMFCLCEASRCTQYVAIGVGPMPVGNTDYAAWRCYEAEQPLAACDFGELALWPLPVTCEPSPSTCIGQQPPGGPTTGLSAWTSCNGQRVLQCGDTGRWVFAE